MRAQVIKSFGGPEVLEGADIPRPVAGPGQVLVRVAASSVNPVDTKIRRKGGAYSGSLPVVLGADAAGVVELDASVMDGSTRAAGAVAALQGFISPVRVARGVERELVERLRPALRGWVEHAVPRAPACRVVPARCADPQLAHDTYNRTVPIAEC